MHFRLAALLAAAILVAFPGESEARRFGSESPGSGNYTVHLAPRDRTSSNALSADAVPAVAPSPQAAAPSAEDIRRQAEKQAAEREIQERAQKAENLRLARLAAEQERAQKQLARERLCVIQPVMTDAEIATCKEVWR